jgi:pimeloyl-ACP methyl ester carboxylesterase
MSVASIDAGTIHYQSTGPATGRPIVFVHGYTMAASLWQPLIELLGSRGARCIAPTWPLGAHREPMYAGADLTMEGVAAMVDQFLAALELDDVVLVGSDTGGAIAQLVATTRPERLGALVLLSCDAFEHFPPPILKPLIAAAKIPPAFRAGFQTMRTRFGRQRAFGALSHGDIDGLVQEWLAPLFADRRVLEDLRRFTASLDGQTMRDAAARLPEFDRPALVAWSADDLFFPLDDGRRLAEVLPNARLEVIELARTFSMLDQPEAVAELVYEFATAPGLARAS